MPKKEVYVQMITVAQSTSFGADSPRYTSSSASLVERTPLQYAQRSVPLRKHLVGSNALYPPQFRFPISHPTKSFHGVHQKFGTEKEIPDRVSIPITPIR